MPVEYPKRCLVNRPATIIPKHIVDPTPLRNVKKSFMKNTAITMAAMIVTLLMAAACEAQLGQPRDVSFQSTLDRTEQFYMELLPMAFDSNKAHDLIIGLHGHGSTRKQFALDARSECASFREFAGKYGMIAVSPDYRAPTSWMGPEAAADIVQLIKGLKAAYKINRVFLVGGSMGASSALTFAVLYPEQVDGVMAMNGLANHVEYKNFQDAINASFGANGGDVNEEKKKRSAEFHPEQLTMPVAFTVGGKDTSVPGDSVKRLYQKLKSMNRKVLMIEQPNGGHGTTRTDAMEALEFMLANAKPVKKNRK